MPDPRDPDQVLAAVTDVNSQHSSFLTGDFPGAVGPWKGTW